MSKDDDRDSGRKRKTEPLTTDERRQEWERAFGAEREKFAALNEWGHLICEMTREVRKRETLSDAEKRALDVVQWIADDFRLRDRCNEAAWPFVDEIVSRMAEAMKPPDQFARVAEAERFIAAAAGWALKLEADAERIRLEAGLPGTRGRGAYVTAARRVKDHLTQFVDERFADLNENEIAALLERYGPDRHRRRTRGGTPSKLSAAGILAKLNYLCDDPLGKLSATGVANAKKRARAKR